MRIPVWLLVGLWLGNLLPALDATLIGTALPTVVGNLNGLSLYSWVFTGYLLSFTISVPVFGKLADIYGRKPIFFTGTAVYLASSALSGLSQNIEQLILFRALAGLGLGAVLPTAITIVGDAFTLEQRAKIQWVFASSWFFSSLVGPTISSFVVINLSWRLAFYLVFPIALGSLFLLSKHYKESIERRRVKVDFLGAVLLGVGMVCFLLAVSFTKGELQSRVGTLALLSGLALLFLGLFVWNERKVSEPILPAGLLLTPLVGASVLANLLSGAVQFGATSFLPLFVQGAQGGTAANAGAVLAPLTVGWPIAAGLGGRILLRIGFRNLALIGMGLVVLSQVGFVMLNQGTPQIFSMMFMAILGLGFGFSTIAFTISVQEVVSWNQRGSATASLQFSRSVGGSLGVGIMGAILAFRMEPLLASQGQGGSVASALLDSRARAGLPPETLVILQSSLAETIHLIFILMAIAAVIGLACTLIFPRGKLKVRSAAETTALREAAAPVRATSAN